MLITKDILYTHFVPEELYRIHDYVNDDNFTVTQYIFNNNLNQKTIDLVFLLSKDIILFLGAEKNKHIHMTSSLPYLLKFLYKNKILYFIDNSFMRKDLFQQVFMKISI